VSAVSTARKSSDLAIMPQNRWCSVAFILRRYHAQSHLHVLRLWPQQGYNRCREPARVSTCVLALINRLPMAGRFFTARCSRRYDRQYARAEALSPINLDSLFAMATAYDPTTSRTWLERESCGGDTMGYTIHSEAQVA